MSRDSGGNYTLPNAAFVSGTVISSSVMNSNFTDLSSEITNSLDRNGKGGMLARWRGVDGTAALPAYAFTSETTLGLWRAGTADLRVANNGTDLFKWTATENRSLQALKVSSGGLTVDAGGATVTAGGLTVTAGGLTVTAGGGTISAGGLSVTGALPSQGGVAGASSFATSGAISTTSGQGHAITGLTNFPAGATANPVRLNVRTLNRDTVDEWQDVAVGFSYDVDSIVGLGGSFYLSPREGLRISAANASTATDPTVAAELTNGHLKLSGANPNSDVAFTNTITPLHTLKAWVRFTTNGLGGVTFVDGLNVTSVAVNGGDVDVTFASAFANTNYTAMGNVFQAFLGVIMNAQTTTVATMRAGTEASGSIDLSATPLTVDVWYIGRQ